MSSRPDLKIDWATHEAAKYACEHWHYSGCVPNQKTVKIGVWEDGEYIGCVIFGDGANGGMFNPYGLTQFQGCELVRVALREHKTPVSRIVRFALIYLRKTCPKIRLVISFADPEYGHAGGIYQAGGWVYSGETEAADEYIVNGSRMHGRALRSTRSTHKAKATKAANVFEWAQKVLDPNVRRVKGSSKHRYLMPLDDEMRKQIEPLRKPYPKRVTKATSGDQSEGGGAVPTHALQDKRDKQAIGGDHPHSGGAAPTVTLHNKRPKQAMESDQDSQRQGSADPDAPNITEAPNGN